MRIYIINCNWGGGGPGSISRDLYLTAVSMGHIVRFAYGRGNIPPNINYFRFSNDADIYLHYLKSLITDGEGSGSNISTKRLIADIERFKPDVINIHNELGHTMNVGMFIEFIRKSGIKTFWTLHDTWLLTGHCITGLCKRFDIGCGKCPRKREYPKSLLIDNSYKNLQRKKRMLTPRINNLSFITPSNWLKKLIQKSYLKDYPVYVINNGIDLAAFSPNDSDLRLKYHLENKIVLLAVANIWSEFKGLRYFYELSKILDRDKFALISIGSRQPKRIGKKSNIISLERTNSVNELSQWYSMADWLINPTLGDNFPTVNLEALACGTPVITFNTGGSPESIQGCGFVVEQKDILAIKDIVEKNSGLIKKETCLARAREFDRKKKYLDYLLLFENA